MIIPRRFFAVLLSVLVMSVGMRANAEEEKNPFAGFEMDALSGTFIVTKSAVNLRAAPGTNGEKIGQLNENEVVKVVGKAKDTSWYAIVRENGEKGFAYSPVFLRLIDGSLKKPMKGSVQTRTGIYCRYDLRYEKSDELVSNAEENLKVADYWVDLSCRMDGKPLTFSVFMFLTEMPWNMTPGGSHQISMELANIAVDYDRVISTVMMWRADQETVVFDSLTPSKFKSSKTIEKKEAKDVPAALMAAVDIGISSWNDELWKIVANKGTAVSPPKEEAEDGEPDRNEKNDGDNEKDGTADDDGNGGKPLPGMEHSGHGDE